MGARQARGCHTRDVPRRKGNKIVDVQIEGDGVISEVIVLTKFGIVDGCWRDAEVFVAVRMEVLLGCTFPKNARCGGICVEEARAAAFACGGGPRLWRVLT